LDASSNKKKSPNENLARELMELFTLGVGHYSERDVKAAARALTGLTVLDEVSRTDPDNHDCGTKTVLGKTGAFSPDNLVDLLVTHPATCSRLAWRIGDGIGLHTSMRELAEVFHRGQLAIVQGVGYPNPSRRHFRSMEVCIRE
jgi:uncharacterized protein (DUF1501 family)